MSGGFRPARTQFRTASTESFVLTLWTADPAIARLADAAGVDRIGVDLERLGKHERQRGLGTWISPHSLSDLAAVGAVLERAELFARVNPLHPGTAAEVEAVLTAGATVLMLPMVASAHDAALFSSIVDARARIVLLIERREAIDQVPAMVRIDGIDEIHLGLNDLALSLRLRNRWMLLAGDLPVTVASVTRAAGLRFGLGGIGRLDDDALPIPPDLMYAQCARTGATAALLARSFHRRDGADLQENVARARHRLAEWRNASAAAIARAHDDLTKLAREMHVW